MTQIKNSSLTVDEIELLCLAIEGGLATSTVDYIQCLISSCKQKNNHDSVRVQSVIKRLENICRELEGKACNAGCWKKSENTKK